MIHNFSFYCHYSKCQKTLLNFQLDNHMEIHIKAPFSTQHHEWLYFSCFRFSRVCLWMCVYLSWAETQRFQWAAQHRGQCTVGRCDEGGNAQRTLLTVCDSLEERDRERKTAKKEDISPFDAPENNKGREKVKQEATAMLAPLWGCRFSDTMFLGATS